MLFAIVCFIFAYTYICSKGSFKKGGKNNNFRNAVRLGTKIRTGISLVGIIGTLNSISSSYRAYQSYLLAPDMISGMLALGVTEMCFSSIMVFRSSSTAGFFDIHLIGRADAFFPTIFTTAVEGLIISISILIISYIIVFLKLFYKKFIYVAR